MNLKKMFSVERSIARWVEDLYNRRRRIRVVVLGSKCSGKTVFLTALASNLLNHKGPCRDDQDVNAFNLNQWEACVEEGAEGPRDPQIPDFPYGCYREGFAKPQPEWPRKTTSEMSVLRLPLVFRKNGHEDKSVLLEFLDLPGERIADLPMVEKAYREWCKWFETSFAGQNAANKAGRDYFEKAKTCQSREELFSAYKEYLKVEYRRYSPWVAPSTVKLTREGKGTGFLQELDSRPLGLDAESQFVPVPDEFFDKKSERREWVKEFSRAYDKYKKVIVEPIRDWVQDADQMVYLLDVLNVLKCGVDAYNQERKFGGAVLGVFRRHKTRMIGGAIVDYFASMLSTHIKKAFLVVTKADLAMSDDSGNLIALAKEMLGKELRGLSDEWDETAVRTCAAVHTVRTKKNEEGGEVPYARVAADAPESEYAQVHVPKHWPDSTAWRENIARGDYWFADTWPLFDEREDASPPQRGLDDLVKALLANVLGD